MDIEKVLNLLIGTLKVPSSLGGAVLKQGARNSIQASHVSSRDPST